MARDHWLNARVGADQDLRCTGLLLDAWDAAAPTAPLSAPAALAVLTGALVLAREAVGTSPGHLIPRPFIKADIKPFQTRSSFAAHPRSPTSFGTRARLLARLARPPQAGESLLVERGLGLLASVLRGQEGKWVVKLGEWAAEAEQRRAEEEERRVMQAEAAVVVKEEEEGWGRFLVE